jgi:hypothetical protein
MTSTTFTRIRKFAAISRTAASSTRSAKYRRRGKPAAKSTPAKNAAKTPAAKNVSRGRRLVATAEAAAVTRNLTFIATAKSASAQSVALSLDRQSVSMQQDSETWTGRKSLNVGDSIAVSFRVTGLDTTKWTFELSIDCPDAPAKVLSTNGTIGQPGGPGFNKDVKIKPDPCAS